MPRLPRWARRPLLAASVALAALVACTGSALAAVSVMVEPLRGAPQTISTEDIAEPSIRGRYDVRDRDRSVRSVHVDDGVTIGQLLDAAAIGTDYRTVEITRPSGRTLVLSRDQIDDPKPPAVLYTDSDGVTWLLRRLPGTDKLYAADRFTGSETLVLRPQRRSPIEVEVNASAEEVAAGESVTFEVSASGAPAGADYIFHWDFRDGSEMRSRKLEITHKFQKAGRYPVLVSASTDSEISEAAEFEVTVGEPEESEQDGGGGTDTSGGSGSGSFGGSSGGGSSGYTPSYDPSYTPPTPAPYTPVPTPPPPTSSKPAPAPGIATDDGSFVEGNLLADAGDPPSGSILESAARAARAGTPSDGDESGGGVPEAALSLAGALALLGLGAALELRQGPTLRLRRG